jgi:hypothetical protein
MEAMNTSRAVDPVLAGRYAVRELEMFPSVFSTLQNKIEVVFPVYQ